MKQRRLRKRELSGRGQDEIMWESQDRGKWMSLCKASQVPHCATGFTLATSTTQLDHIFFWVEGARNRVGQKNPKTLKMGKS